MSYQFRAKPIKKSDPELTPRLKKIQKYCDEHNTEFVMRGDDYNEIEFYDAVKNNPDSLIKRIAAIYRVQIPSPKQSEDKKSTEVLIYYMQQEAIRYDGRPIQDNRMHGVYQVPTTRDNRNMHGKTTRTQIMGTVPIYEIPFAPDTVDEIISKSSIGVRDYHMAYGMPTGPEVISASPLTIRNLNDFKEGNFQELVDMSTYNYTTIEPRLAQWRKESREIKANAHIYQTMAGGGGPGQHQPSSFNNSQQRNR